MAAGGFPAAPGIALAGTIKEDPRDVQPGSKMPQVFRAMRRDEDGLPTVDRAANALGVRLGTDLDVDPRNNAVVNHKGMSVSPGWRDLPIFRIPRRLGGQGSNNTHCFTTGTG